MSGFPFGTVSATSSSATGFTLFGSATAPTTGFTSRSAAANPSPFSSPFPLSFAPSSSPNPTSAAAPSNGLGAPSSPFLLGSGATAAGSSLFGTPPSAAPSTGSSLFGGGSLFGSSSFALTAGSSAPASTAPSLFGTASSSPLFGTGLSTSSPFATTVSAASTATTPPGFSTAFSSRSLSSPFATSGAGASLFGSSSLAATSTPSLFGGSSSASPFASTASSGLSLGTTATPAAPSSGFSFSTLSSLSSASTAAAPQLAFSGFGTTQASTTPAPASQPAFSGFGITQPSASAAAAPQSAFSGFGTSQPSTSPAPASQPAISGFGSLSGAASSAKPTLTLFSTISTTSSASTPAVAASSATSLSSFTMAPLTSGSAASSSGGGGASLSSGATASSVTFPSFGSSSVATATTNAAPATSSAGPSNFATSASTSVPATTTSAPAAAPTSSVLAITSSSGTTSSVTPSVSSALKLPSEITGKSVEEIIKEWNSELQQRTGKFRTQAAAIAEWDKKILQNRDDVLKLKIEVAKVVETQSHVGQQLELIEAHQDESLDLLNKISEMDGNISLKITTVSFNGRNYLSWSKAVFIALCGRGRVGFINGDLPAPAITDPKFVGWRMYDHQVMSWLLNSIDAELHDLFTFALSAKELWDSIKALYSHQENLYRIFELKKSIADLQKGDRPFVEYLSKLKSMWYELSTLRPASSDPIVINKREEEERIFKVLMGLGPEFEVLQEQILTAAELPSFNVVCARIQKEETCKKLVSSYQKNESGNLVTFVCDDCGKIGHLKEKCWILHPQQKEKANQERSNSNAFAASSSNHFSIDDLAQKVLMHLQTSNDTSEYMKLQSEGKNGMISRCHSAVSKFGLSANILDQPWIIDSGANENMTKDRSAITSFKPLNNQPIIIANGKGDSYSGKRKDQHFS